MYIDETGLQCVFLYEDSRKAPFHLDEDKFYYGLTYNSPILAPDPMSPALPNPRLPRGGVPFGPSVKIVGNDIDFIGVLIQTNTQQAQVDVRYCYLCDDPSELREDIECSPSSSITCTEWERRKKGEPEVFRQFEFISETIRQQNFNR